jgi:RimJ/RimL family protein N-acetyltransferase
VAPNKFIQGVEMQIQFHSVAPDLSRENLTLTQLNESFIDRYCDLMADPISRHFTGTTETFSQEQLLQWLKTRPGQTQRLDWAIIDSATHELVGELVLNEFEKDSQTMNLRIALFSAMANQGFGTKAIQLVVDYAFQTLQLKRIRLDVWSENARAIRVYEKVGFALDHKITEADREYWVMVINRPIG